MQENHTVQLNYVIPQDLDGLLTQYCEQNLVSPSALVRQLILEYLEGDREVDAFDHPRGRRTTVALTENLLKTFETTVDIRGHKTKASVIAALLYEYLPNRIHSAETIRVDMELPVDVFNTIFEVFGPGPTDKVVQTALESVVNSLAPRSETVKEAS